MNNNFPSDLKCISAVETPFSKLVGKGLKGKEVRLWNLDDILLVRP